MQIGSVLQQQWKKAGIIYFQARKESTLEYMGCGCNLFTNPLADPEIPYTYSRQEPSDCPNLAVRGTASLFFTAHIDQALH